MTNTEKMLDMVGITEEEMHQPTIEEKLDALMEYMGLKVKPIGDGVFEVVKETVGSGDYTDPILFVPPMDIEQGKWYYTDAIGKDLPREALTDANKVTDFDNSMVFDWV